MHECLSITPTFKSLTIFLIEIFKLKKNARVYLKYASTLNWTSKIIKKKTKINSLMHFISLLYFSKLASKIINFEKIIHNYNFININTNINIIIKIYVLSLFYKIKF